MIFFDLETAPFRSDINKLDDRVIALYDKKVRARHFLEETLEKAYESAGLYPEFGRIVCATFGFAHADDKGPYFRMRSFCGRDEKAILQAIADTFPPDTVLCGHNSKSFDIPYLCKRMLALGVPLPSYLKLHGKKPWEVKHEDTMEIWKFGGRDYTSLDVLSMCLGIPSPKSDMDGSQVGKAFYEGRIGEIATYCSRDVLTTANCYFKMMGKSLIERDTHEITVL
jgi:DNA polymerase elongation subunit (family B)